MRRLKKLALLMNKNCHKYILIGLNQTLGSDVTFTRASSATYFDSTGILKTATTNVPRFTYDPATLAYKGLIIEGARTNKYIQGTNVTGWAKASNNILTLNSLISPDGTTNAAHLIPDNTAGQHWFGGANNPTITAGANWSISGYFKRNGTGPNNRYFRFTMRNSDWSGIAGFDVDLANGVIQPTSTGTGTVGNVSITNVGNGWYRCVANNCYTSATNTAIIVEGFFMASFGGSSTTTGDGVNGVGLWGMQFEENIFASSFIPTTTAAVTRAADVCTVTSLSSKPWFNFAEGTILADFSRGALNIFSQIVSINDASNNNYYSMYQADTAASYSYNSGIASGGAGQASASSSPGTGQVKSAFAYKTNDCAFVANGGTVSKDTSVTLPVSPTQFQIGAHLGGSTMFGTIRQLAYCPKRIANNTLQKLTQ